MTNTKRTATLGELRLKDAGKTVILNGWVTRVRKLGSLLFILLRDRYGTTQAVVKESSCKTAEIAAELKSEWCISLEGVVRERDEKDKNPDMPTGEIEVEAKEITVFTKSAPLPFSIEEVRQKDGSLVQTSEELRLRYRYLDLRRQKMQKNIILRSAVTFAVREFLVAQGFLEIETPTFIKSTPEGARDYLVPSRINVGTFYSLPQSPQLYKQLLMVSTFDKYFQIARCYRDEDPRGDRQPEFTQIDMEMSFTDREEVLEVTEKLMRHVFKSTLSYDIAEHFERLTWEEAMDTYGSDKPDLRFHLPIKDAAFMKNLTDFAPFVKAGENADINIARHKRSAIKALVIPDGAKSYSRKKIEELEKTAKIYKASVLFWTKVGNIGELEGGVAKHFSSHAREICEKLEAKSGDLLLFVAEEKWQTACAALGGIRIKAAKDLSLYEKNDRFHFVWIIDFPYFAWNEEENKWEPEHHMFSMPKKEYWSTLESDTGSVKGDLYDLVLNGYELASGSIRINDPALQERIFEIVGYSRQRAEEAFGFLLEAFKYGAPPHGGIAPGLDRLLMIMAEEDSIKEVIAFPKNNLAQSPLDKSPSKVSDKQLEELHIKLID